MTLRFFNILKKGKYLFHSLLPLYPVDIWAYPLDYTSVFIILIAGKKVNNDNASLLLPMKIHSSKFFMQLKP